MDIAGDEFSDYVPPIPLTPEGWEKWTVKEVVLLAAAMLAGDGNTDRVRFADSLDSTIQMILKEPWDLMSHERQAKATVVRVALSSLPKGATFSITSLGEVLSNLEQRNLAWEELLALTGRNMLANTGIVVKEAVKLPIVALTQGAKEADRETGGTSSWLLAGAGIAAAGVGLIYLGPLILPLVAPLLRKIK